MLKEILQVVTSRSQHKVLDILVQSTVISVSKKKWSAVMEKSIRNTLKDSRNSTTSCLFCLYVPIQTKIQVFLTNSTWYIRLLTSDWRNIKITFHTSYHRGSSMLRCGKSVTCTSSEIRRLRITEPLWSSKHRAAKF